MKLLKFSSSFTLAVFLFSARLFSQTIAVHKTSDTVTLHKARPHNVSNKVTFKVKQNNSFKIDKNKVHQEGKSSNLSNITASAYFKEGFFLGPTYNLMWPLSARTYLGFGLGAYYLNYNVHTDYPVTSGTLKGYGISLPLTLRCFLGSNFYFEPFIGPQYSNTSGNNNSQTVFSTSRPVYPSGTYTTFTYGNQSASTGSSLFNIQGGCNLGCRFGSGFDLSFRWHSDFGLGFGLGYTKK